MLKCPYCIEGRQTRLSLMNHVLSVHRDADTRERMAAAVAAAKPVPESKLDNYADANGDRDCDVPRCVVQHDTASDLAAPPVASTQPKCICGGELVQVETEPGEPLWWVHTWGSPNGAPCTDSAPVCDTVRQQDRASLSEHFAETGRKLAQAGEELDELKTQARIITTRLMALDAGTIKPGAIRRAALLSIWDKLMDAGNISGAQLVMSEINKGGEWS